jgi:hypothetical protein
MAELGLIDEYEFVVQPRLVGHGPTLCAVLSKRDLRLVILQEFGTGAVAIRYQPRVTWRRLPESNGVNGFAGTRLWPIQGLFRPGPV